MSSCNKVCCMSRFRVCLSTSAAPKESIWLTWDEISQLTMPKRVIILLGFLTTVCHVCVLFIKARDVDGFALQPRGIAHLALCLVCISTIVSIFQRQPTETRGLAFLLPPRLASMLPDDSHMPTRFITLMAMFLPKGSWSAVSRYYLVR